MVKTKCKRKIIWVLAFISVLFFLFSAFILVASKSPIILSASVYPEKVTAGQAMLIKAEIKDNLIIKNVKASIETDDKPDIAKLLLVDGSIRQGKYERVWIAHDTSAQKWYNITITATNLLGKKAVKIISYQDPTQSHNASEIVGGTFGMGNYVFPNNVTINKTATINSIILNSTILLQPESNPANQTGYAKIYYKVGETVIDSYTKLLLHADGTGATFTDSETTPKTVTSNGDATQDATQSKFGGKSAKFDGTGDYLSLADSNDWYFGTGDFTVDFWVMFNSLTADPGFASQSDGVGNNMYMLMFMDSKQIYMSFEIDGGAVGRYITTNAWSGVATGTWYHIAFERYGTGAKIFIDGVSQTLTAIQAFGTNDVGNIASDLVIGIHGNKISYPLNGWLDEFRISKGIARWTSNFNVPTSAYADIPGGLVFQYQNGTIKTIAGE